MYSSVRITVKLKIEKKRIEIELRISEYDYTQ